MAMRRISTIFYLVVSVLFVSIQCTQRTQGKVSTPIAGQSWTINIRRDTSNGLPYGTTHSVGISSIVWGDVIPTTIFTVTLHRDEALLAEQVVRANSSGWFSISMDHLIEDGDTVRITDGQDEKIIQVPVMTYTIDTVNRTVTGIAPSNIASTVYGSPHSLYISLAGVRHHVTTTETGSFFADFGDRLYLAGLLGTMRYTTPDGDNIFKPVWAMDPFARGKTGDGWADIILGQPDFSEIVFNDVIASHLFNPQGVHIDRSVQPNRLYVYDAGNSRILGLSTIGICQNSAAAPCTSDSDCLSPAICQISPTLSADLVLGQPDAYSSACNGDNGFQMFPDVPLADADNLCGLREEQMSVSEGGSGVTMATDNQGNLYVPDFFNNRILRYDNPFGMDTRADYVWGQTDFQGIFCNRGAGFSHPSAVSLCFSPPAGIGDLRAGITLDSQGNLWVTDSWNNRVLRFLKDASGVPATRADLVLGQSDFNSAGAGTDLDQMHNPASIQITTGGTVYVADSLNNRVLVFDPPFSNGMSATRVIDTGLNRPTGLGLDPADGLWVNDNGHNRFIHYVGETAQEIINGVDEEGGLGIDRDGNVFAAGWALQSVLRFTTPNYQLENLLFEADPLDIFNQTTARSLYGGHGLEIAAGQLIHSDESRLLFWNHPWNLQNHQPADGVIGAPDFETRDRWGQRFTRMRADENGKLWVLFKGASSVTSIRAYQLPLVTRANPVLQITSPLPLLGGGELTWSLDFFLGGIDVQPGCDCLWVTDEGNNRALRIRNASTQPIVDIVLGQVDASGTECNQGRGRNSPSQDSLCHPGALSFDRDGNLYIADHNLEFDGNLRMLVWDASQLPDAPVSAVFGIPANHVLGRNGSFTEPNCQNLRDDPFCGPWEPAFDMLGNMAIGFNGYLGSRFPLIYHDPLNNPYPVTALGDFHSMPLSARYDDLGNLYIPDHNRSRILIYKTPSGQTFSIHGSITTSEGNTVAGVQVQMIDYAIMDTTDSQGNFSFTDLITGTYAIRPISPLYTFSPAERTVAIPPSTTDINFVVDQQLHALYLSLILQP